MGGFQSNESSALKQMERRLDLSKRIHVIRFHSYNMDEAFWINRKDNDYCDREKNSTVTNYMVKNIINEHSEKVALSFKWRAATAVTVARCLKSHLSKQLSRRPSSNTACACSEYISQHSVDVHQGKFTLGQ
ncbi:hypothetical protein CEXT_283501 [Caerostris extrusa]|uniref:Uncharacterized protein n=1 Tax=Caerostris extrusa TaxID=172846 RepID=A0AAV4WUM7_CAEEX|nr:hypothetical protein CEXT_283501 [Caerostris extrusa]